MYTAPRMMVTTAAAAIQRPPSVCQRPLNMSHSPTKLCVSGSATALIMIRKKSAANLGERSFSPPMTPRSVVPVRRCTAPTMYSMLTTSTACAKAW